MKTILQYIIYKITDKVITKHCDPVDYTYQLSLIGRVGVLII